jgi:hypothetical protein
MTEKFVIDTEDGMDSDILGLREGGCECKEWLSDCTKIINLLLFFLARL